MKSILQAINALFGMTEGVLFPQPARGTPPRRRRVPMSGVTRGRWTGSRKLNKMGKVE